MAVTSEVSEISNPTSAVIRYSNSAWPLSLEANENM